MLNLRIVVGFTLCFALSGCKVAITKTAQQDPVAPDPTSELAPGIAAGGDAPASMALLSGDETQAAAAALREQADWRQRTAVGLQLGAFREPAGAAARVHRLREQFPLMFADRSTIIRKINRDGTPLYRLILGPFASAASAETFCAQLRSDGQDCLLRGFDRVDLVESQIAESDERSR